VKRIKTLTGSNPAGTPENATLKRRNLWQHAYGVTEPYGTRMQGRLHWTLLDKARWICYATSETRGTYPRVWGAGCSELWWRFNGGGKVPVVIQLVIQACIPV